MTQPIRIVHDRSSNGNADCVSKQTVDNDASYRWASAQQHTQERTNLMSSNTVNNEQSGASNESALDYKLVSRVQQGDNAAFDLLVLKYQGRVASIISRYVSDRHEIADVAQEAFIKAYRAIEKFRSDSAFYTWLYRIAVNCAKNYLISKGRKTPSVDIDIDDAQYSQPHSRLEDITNPADQLNRDQLEALVYTTIGQLPEDLRVALTLREFEGLSYDEIAKVMDCPVGTVRSRIFRARDSVDQAIRQAQGETE